ncbi:MAG: hypothetical protein ABFC31_07160 [Clostridiaceae bacterium]
MKTVDTFTAQIAVGFKNIDTGEELSVRVARDICQGYCNKVGLCVTLTETEFIYTDGNERGCLIGLINYPRFPSNPDRILEHAIAITRLLLNAYKQYKVSIICGDETYMIERESEEKS